MPVKLANQLFQTYQVVSERKIFMFNLIADTAPIEKYQLGSNPACYKTTIKLL